MARRCGDSVMREHIDHAELAIEAIDHVLAEPPITLEDALHEAVQAGRMTVDEAAECLDAYMHAFHPEDGA